MRLTALSSRIQHKRVAAEMERLEDLTGTTATSSVPKEAFPVGSVVREGLCSEAEFSDRRPRFK